MMKLLAKITLATLAAFACSPLATAQSYIGYVYPAGGKQGETFQVKLGGQRLAGINKVMISGKGVSAKLVKYERRLSNQDTRLLREQLVELRREIHQENPKRKKAKAKAKRKSMMMESTMMDTKMMDGAKPGGKKNAHSSSNPAANPETLALIDSIEKRLAAYVRRPASASLAEITYAEVTIAPNAEPGTREIRLATPRGITNPLVFIVGQIPETSRRPMYTQQFQVLGKEAASLRKRLPEEAEVTINIPCTANGQIGSGEINRYRFTAKKGQNLVVSVKARELIPYVADAVPGWFQPVVTLHDAEGNEVAYQDDYRFNPDPSFLFLAPKDGEYICSIHDSIYRGREDFVYRLTIGELPFLTGVHPLGRRTGRPAKVTMTGWNLKGAKLNTPPADAEPGTYQITATKGKLVSNPVPFLIGSQPERHEKEPNNSISHPQTVALPLTVNGRINRKDDTDVFRFTGKKDQKIVAEIHARRLGSPVDSMLKITRADGQVLALNDDHEDLASGTHTHHADSYVMLSLPEDGDYFAHVTDTARNGGKDYTYRLSIRPPQPDFELRATPSHAVMRTNGGNAVEVHIIRKDGFVAPVRLDLINPPEGFSCWNAILQPHMDKVKFGIKNSLGKAAGPVALSIKGTATVGGREITRQAVPAEDRMQAFLWRHLVPAQELQTVVFYQKSTAKKKKPGKKNQKSKTEKKPKAKKKQPAKAKSTAKN